MKKGFISIYVLLILLALSISIGFIFSQAENNMEFNYDLYDRKKAQYKAESILNIYLSQNEDEIRNRIASFKEKKIYKPYNKVNYEQEEYSLSYNDHLKILDIDDVYSFTTNNIKIGNSIATATAFIKPKYSPIIDSKEMIIIDDKVSKTINLLKFNEDMIITDKLSKSNEKIVNIKNDLIIDDKSPNKHKGILIIDGNLTVDKDFVIEGLLIVKGDIKANNKLIVKGQIIKREGNNDNIELKYLLSNYINYLVIDETMIESDIIIKKVY